VKVGIPQLTWFLFQLMMTPSLVGVTLCLVAASLLLVLQEGAATIFIGGGLAAESYGGE
jgi:hypothetical protein